MLRRAVPALAVVLLVSAPVATAWLVGDLTNAEARRLAAEGEPLDYAVRPIDLGATEERVLGVLATALVVVSLALLARATATRALHPRWWTVLAPLLASAVLIGVAWRVVTAGAIGANIGAGLVLLAGGPVLLVLLVVAAVQAVRLRRSGRAAV
ncbi:hypothetical protein [Micromonospora sp. WMMD1082]|uniref:hypothetical protein n=1 Tax=Micromonospora sp. WMMD1082 TaxID=3016104 RepID=UPI002417CBB6|nr:hypothetical protein [Micromonospora sp. WMMD1082]MDG4794425.1 hypothetical protein [Micromonospora sp. WMMD1082]